MTLRITALLVTLLAVSACNTLDGVGRDVEEGGEAIQDAAS
ncbi:entericidin A/B family lipoprotein [Litoreibacter roseus]|uniref:Entericidin EcnA/B family protein n=1 Tax=Litoreibacter roseus TaxID=2601869 RepID=A0A6N6JND5_9RHOB|nr:entericidin A/B family lipoprotein [Litoreibacter roseus]GFE66918.1 hypothetical protein KIN_39920 [Litoreibacter roseus]